MTRLYYFSGTGNTLWSAKKIAASIGSETELINIGTETEDSGIVTVEADAVVFLFPSYAYGLPVIVRRFLRRTEFKTPYAAAFVTFGTQPGGTLAQAARILKRKNIGGLYFGRIPAVENYIAIFGPPDEETERQRLAMQTNATEEAAGCITQRCTNNINMFRPFSGFVWFLFTIASKIFKFFYRVGKTCNGCGLCAKMCPVSAITISGGRPAFSGKCQHCQCCLNWCPQNAITFGIMRTETPRYHHPGITAADMINTKKR